MEPVSTAAWRPFRFNTRNGIKGGKREDDLLRTACSGGKNDVIRPLNKCTTEVVAIGS